MLDRTKHYISGEWTASSSDRIVDVINPATELIVARIADGTKQDVERAVRAARKAFPAWSTTSREDRTVRLRRLRSIYERRLEEMAEAISQEMGAPIRLSRTAHAPSGLEEIDACTEILQKFDFEKSVSEGENTDLIVYEPIGVCGLITPWNWPISQVALKVFQHLRVDVPLS